MQQNSTLQQSKQFQPISVEQKIQNQSQNHQGLGSRRNFGTMIPIMVDPASAEPKYLLGPHFYLFIPVWIIALGLLIFFVVSLAGKANPILLTLSILLGLIFLYMYAKVGFSLPGVASSSKQPDFAMRSNERYCIPCKIVRPKGTHHCYYCDVCIYQMDHHCPWVGKCIGRDNLIKFYKFLVSVTALMVSLVLTAILTGKTVQNN